MWGSGCGDLQQISLPVKYFFILKPNKKTYILYLL